MQETHQPLKGLSVPAQRIAIKPAAKPEDSRLLTVHQSGRGICDTHFRALPELMQQRFAAGPKPMLVFNVTKVQPRLFLFQDEKSKSQEMICMSDSHGEWVDGQRLFKCVLSGRKRKEGSVVFHLHGLKAEFVSRESSGLAWVKFNLSGHELEAFFQKHGRVPLPPYIRAQRKRQWGRDDDVQDEQRYQSVLAESGVSVAAPTASLHFSRSLLDKLMAWGANVQRVRLDVGWGTFGKLTQDHWDKDALHSENIDVSSDVAKAMLEQKNKGGSVIAVGTTVVRTLESWAQEGCPSEGVHGPTDLFLHPPKRPKVVDELITNFHLPDSSLIELVQTFMDRPDDLANVYGHALAGPYRFYSYGDGMWVQKT